jgi:hypothetical protein
MEERIFEGCTRNLSKRGEDSDCDRQIETRPFLFNLSRRKINEHLALESDTQVRKGYFNPIPRLSDCRVR